MAGMTGISSSRIIHRSFGRGMFRKRNTPLPQDDDDAVQRSSCVGRVGMITWKSGHLWPRRFGRPIERALAPAGSEERINSHSLTRL
jgi:hypothetical protein